MFLRALGKSILRRPQRFVIAVVAVAMGIGMAVALASVSLVLGDRLGRTVRHYGANLVLVPRGADLPLEVAGVDYSALVDAGVAAIPASSLAARGTFRWRNAILGFHHGRASEICGVRSGEAVKARALGGLLQRHAVIDDVANHLHVPLRLLIAAGCAAHEPRFAVAINHIGV